jgi:cysteine desulfurase
VRRIYFDHNATTPLCSAARDALSAWLDEPGNPSSLHAEGRRAREAVEQARDCVAQLVGARREEIVFTSGGTEADNLAVWALAQLGRATAARRTRVVLSPIEHPAVDEAAAALAALGFARVYGRVDGDGRLDLDALAALVDDETALVAVQLANHEIGTLQEVAAIARLARAAGAWVHCDAVQAAGKIPVDARALGVDTLAISAHKIGGPKGAGALFVRDGVDLASPLRGGGQERGRRPGTENVLGILGLGAAASACAPLSTALRDRFEAGAVALGARVHGGGAPRVPNTVNVAFAGVDGELLMEALDLEGVAVSTGAACSSGKLEPSPVIRAIGGHAGEAVRFSFGPGNTVAEIDGVLALLPSLLERIRRA